MTSKELVHAALAGRPTPRVPTGPLAVHFCARVAGYTLRQYTTDAEALADSVIRYHERFRPDAVWLSADTWVSAEAMGAQVGALDDDQPFGGLGDPLVQSAADLDCIPAPNVATQGRYPLMIKALSRIVSALGKDVFIVACFDQYPFSLAAALMGINEIMLKLHEDPAFVQAVMARCEDYALAYGQALAATGADLLSGGDSPVGLVGPRSYVKLLLPAEQRLIRKLKSSTGKLVSLHICGNTTRILSPMAWSGADVLELDHAVDIGGACRAVGPGMGLWANLDPVSVLARGTPAEVTAEARKVLTEVQAAGHQRFVLSSGCTLAVETPYQNLQALLAVSGSDSQH